MSKIIEWQNDFAVSDFTEGTRSILKIPQHVQTDLDCHSMVNYESIIEHILEIIRPRSITEIGVDKFQLSLYLAKAAARLKASLMLIDSEFPAEYPKILGQQDSGVRFDFRKGASVDILTRETISDMMILGRDHNYRTALSDLQIIDSRKPTGEPLVIMLQNVGWPYGRRDLFHSTAELSAQEDLGAGELSPFDTGPSESGLIWNHTWFAKKECGPENGVLTAMEDFLKTSARHWETAISPLFYGLAILWDVDSLTASQQKAMGEIAASLEFCHEINSTAELNRIMLLIRLNQAGKIWAKLKARNTVLEKENQRRELTRESIIPRAPKHTGDPITKFFPLPHTVNYLVNLSSKLNCMYVETPKVACSTIKKTLQLMEVDGDIDKLPKNVHDKQHSPLLSPRQDMAFFQKALLDDNVIRFSFVRNPFTRILSCFLDKFVSNEWERKWRLPKLGFDPSAKICFLDFLKVIRDQEVAEMDIHWMPQSYILSRSNIDYTYIGRFEYFDMDFARILATIKKEKKADHMKIENHSSHATNADNKISKYLGAAEKRIILEIYEKDFTEFLYSRSDKLI